MSGSTESMFEKLPHRTDAPNDARKDSEKKDSEKTVIRQGELIDISLSQAEHGDNRPDSVGKGSDRSGVYNAAESLIGQQLDHFLIESLVGTGGMGAVFRGRDLRLDRVVAIKVVPVGDRSAEAMKRFRFEAQSAAKLDHPNIARVYYVGETHEWSYIVFEFVEGTNLRELVLKQGLLSIDEAVCLTRQVAEALQHASERKVVHRDIKPSNILVTQAGQAKLVDMGLARTTELDKSTNDLTASGVTLGTFDYISPEQAHDPRGADVRSDIYSLGCTLYFLLTGQPPFPDGTALQKLLLHGTKLPEDPRYFRSDISDSMIAILRKMMAKKPGDRYQEPNDLIQDLRTLADLEELVWAKSSDNTAILPATSQRTWLEASLPFLVSMVAVFGIALWLRSISAAFPIPREVILDADVASSVKEPSVGGMTPLLPADKSTQISETGSPANTLPTKPDGKASSAGLTEEDTITVSTNGVFDREKNPLVVRTIDQALELAMSQPQIKRIVIQSPTVTTSLSTLKGTVRFQSNLTIQAENGQRCKWMVDGSEVSAERIDSTACFECVQDQLVLQNVDIVWRVNAMSRRRALFSINAGAWLECKDSSVTIQEDIASFSGSTFEPTFLSMGTSLPSVFLVEESTPDAVRDMASGKSQRLVARISGSDFFVRGYCDWLRFKSPARTEIELENGWMAIAGSMIESSGSRVASRSGVALRIDMRNVTVCVLRSWMRCNLSNLQPYPIPTVRIANECVFTGCKSLIDWNAVECQDWNLWEQSEQGKKLTKWIDLRGMDNTYDDLSLAHYFSLKMSNGISHSIPLDPDAHIVGDERGLETAAAWKKRPLLEATRLHEATFESLEWSSRSFQPGYQSQP